MKGRQNRKIARRIRKRITDGMDESLVLRLAREELSRLLAGERPYRSPRNEA